MVGSAFEFTFILAFLGRVFSGAMALMRTRFGLALSLFSVLTAPSTDEPPPAQVQPPSLTNDADAASSPHPVVADTAPEPPGHISTPAPTPAPQPTRVVCVIVKARLIQRSSKRAYRATTSVTR